MNKRKFRKAITLLINKYEALYNKNSKDTLASGQYYAIIYAFNEALKLTDKEYLDKRLNELKNK